VINAIVDALAELGVRHIEMPATPERVWRAIRAGRSAAATTAEREHARGGQITTCQVHGYPPIVIALLIRAARPSHPSA
jgi:hypothetical protein